MAHQKIPCLALAISLGAGLPAPAQPTVPKTAAEENRTAEESQAASDNATAEESSNEAPEPIELFEQLLVVGSPERARFIPGSAHAITLEELERQEHTDVHRILRQVPGVNIQEEDGYGLRPNIGLRGTGVERSQKITLLEDGVLIAPAPYSAPSAYYSPTAGRMESLEVRKGSGAIRQGPHTNGGALNYVSRSIPSSLGGGLRLATGNDTYRRGLAWVGDSRETVAWLLETYQEQTDGFKRLDGGGGTGFELADYVAKLRFNSPSDAQLHQAVELKLGRTDQVGNETYLGLTRSDFDRTPYRRYAASAGDRITADHEQAQLGYFIQPSRGLTVTATAYRNDFSRNWFKLEKVDGVSLPALLDDPAAFARQIDILRGDLDSEPDELAVRNNRRDYTSRGAQAVLSWRLARGPGDHRIEAGLRFHEDQEDRFQEEDLFQMVAGRRQLTTRGEPGSNANRIAEARAVALFLQDTFTTGRWTWSPGVRLESIDLSRRDFGRSDPARSGDALALRENHLFEVIPGLGVTYRLDDASSLIAGVHRGFSPPSPSSTEQVEAEESINYELGWRRQSGTIASEIVAFYSDYDNLLGNDTVSGGGEGTGDQFNGGAVDVAGLEAGLSIDLAPRGRTAFRLPLRLTYTYTTSEFGRSFETDFADWAPRVERGDELPYLPRHQLFAGLSVEHDAWAVHLDAGYTSQMRTRAGSGPIQADEAIESRVLLDLKAEYRVRSNLTLWGQLLNATDETYVAARRPAGLRPGRPRAVLFGLSLDFGG